MELVIGEQQVANLSAQPSLLLPNGPEVANMNHTIRILWAFAPLRRAARSAPV
jgi:hypothetical protein